MGDTNLASFDLFEELVVEFADYYDTHGLTKMVNLCNNSGSSQYRLVQLYKTVEKVGRNMRNVQ
jgi:hypothetical protein